MGWSAFAPKGPTVAISVTVAASASVQALPSPGEQQCTNYLVANTTSQGCYLSYGPNAGAALASAVVPVPGTPTNTVWLGGNTAQSLTFGPATFFSTIAPATTTTVLVTPGDGL